MPSSARWPWRYLFAIEIVGVMALGCSDSPESCGPNTGDEGITATLASSESASYSAFLASANNDCPNAGSPTSVTVSAGQEQGFGSLLLCISRPERISNGNAIAVTTDGDVRLLSISAELSCPTVIDTTLPFDVTATFSGYCGDGVDPAGFSLELDGEIPVLVQCQGQQDAMDVLSIAGTATVMPE